VRRRSPLSRLRILSSAIAATAVAATLIGSSASLAADPVAAAAPAGPVENDETHATALFDADSGKGIVVLLGDPTGDDGRLLIAMQGVAPRARHGLLLSPHPCGTPHDRTSPSIKFDGIDGEVVASTFQARRRVVGLLPFIEQDDLRSVRLFRTSGTPREVACAEAIVFADGSVQSNAAAGAPQPSLMAYQLENVLVSSYSFSGRPTAQAGGIVLAEPTPTDSFSLNFEEIRMTFGTHRVVGSQAACGTRNTTATTVFSHAFEASAAGNNGRDVVTPALKDPLSVASIRFYAGESGFRQPRGCSNIIAVLIAL
jgi:hypothetical protein